jgi:hypothetical protein
MSAGIFGFVMGVGVGTFFGYILAALLSANGKDKD